MFKRCTKCLLTFLTSKYSNDLPVECSSSSGVPLLMEGGNHHINLVFLLDGLE